MRLYPRIRLYKIHPNILDPSLYMRSHLRMRFILNMGFIFMMRSMFIWDPSSYEIHPQSSYMKSILVWDPSWYNIEYLGSYIYHTLIWCFEIPPQCWISFQLINFPRQSNARAARLVEVTTTTSHGSVCCEYTSYGACSTLLHPTCDMHASLMSKGFTWYGKETEIQLPLKRFSDSSVSSLIPTG